MTQEISFTSGSSFGQYRIVKSLGKGGMGSVYEAEHTVLGKRYAIKVLNEELTRDKGLLDRLKREAHVLANLDHPNIVKVDEFGEIDGKLWLRMELVQGRDGHSTLQDWMDVVKGPFEEKVATEIISEILEGLQYAHGKGAIHRDLKPSNILLTENGLKIADFGLVKLAGEEWYKSQIQESIVKTMVRIDDERTVVEGSGSSKGTSSRAMMGTFEYMAPEVKEGGEATTQSDIYAVGLMSFQLLTGKKTLGMELACELNPALSETWDEWIKNAVHSDPEMRKLGRVNHDSYSQRISKKDRINVFVSRVVTKKMVLLLSVFFIGFTCWFVSSLIDYSPRQAGIFTSTAIMRINPASDNIGGMLGVDVAILSLYYFGYGAFLVPPVIFLFTSLFLRRRLNPIDAVWVVGIIPTCCFLLFVLVDVYPGSRLSAFPLSDYLNINGVGGNIGEILGSVYLLLIKLVGGIAIDTMLFKIPPVLFTIGYLSFPLFRKYRSSFRND